ncbi:pirin family protein [Hymenobacter sp. YC55]|uniref:pirin family protein n=1 Tax=Hymenobacter sp. YC55 TaxID=3034019 RepID=UPI0023F8EB5C|nr:pirin family protein [Hymenobacter sp. YC55]MDF7815887.1 pirin family protein [Hymenobacter sp. YC55]
MEKASVTRYSGVNAKVGDLLVNRLLPSQALQSVGHFVFLDHLYPTSHQAKAPQAPTGEFAHPHRGIATFTYLFSGSLEHYDSNGQHGIVEAGGAQWMKAGRGVMHDENPSPRFQAEGGVLHAVQFWINLPSSVKAEAPEYLALHPQDIPVVDLPAEAGRLRIVIGSFGDTASPVKTFSQQYLYHLQLNPKASFRWLMKPGLEYAAFVPGDAVLVNGRAYGQSELLVVAPNETVLTFTSTSITPTDVLLFGGEPYTEPMVAQGPFIMNSHAEIAEAYEDFFAGKYGQIHYQPLAIQS